MDGGVKQGFNPGQSGFTDKKLLFARRPVLDAARVREIDRNLLLRARPY